MKWMKLLIILTLLYSLTWANESLKEALGDLHGDLDRIMSSKIIPRRNISVQNDYVQVFLAPDSGRFYITTSDSLARKRLMYNHGKTWSDYDTIVPWSSWTAVRVDGKSYKTPRTPNHASGTDFADGTMVVSSGFSIVNWPTNPDSNYIYGTWVIPEKHIEVRQILQPVYLEYPDYTTGTVFIKYVIINNDSLSHNIGVLLFLDTMIDRNDSARIATSAGYTSGISALYWNLPGEPVPFPCYWYAYADPLGPIGPPDQLVALGIMCGYDAVPPTRFGIGYWSSLYGYSWNDSYYHWDERYTDSAVLLWWWSEPIDAHDTLIVSTYYGLGEEIPGELVLQIPEFPKVKDCDYAPNPFEVLLIFTNGLSFILDNTEGEIILPDGMTLDSGYSPVNFLSPDRLLSGQSATTHWKICIDSVGTMGDSICVKVTSPSTDSVFIACRKIELASIIKPHVDLRSPFLGAVSSCERQELLFNISYANPIEELLFTVDSETLDLSDSRLTIQGDSLLKFKPSSSWDNNQLYDFGILALSDSFSCIGNTAAGQFITDFGPPQIGDAYPPNDIIFTSTKPFVATLELWDVERAVDPNSIHFSVNGVGYRVSDPALEYFNDTIWFDFNKAGIMQFEDWDTFCLSLRDATDILPDLCGPNHITSSKTWCFSVRIVDLFLPDTIVEPDGFVEIPMTIDDISNLKINNFEIEIKYNDSVLRPTDIITDGTLTEDWFDPDIEILGSGLARISGIGSFLLGEGVLFKIRFRIISLESYTTIKFGNVSLNHGTIEYKTHNGRVIILGSDPFGWMLNMLFKGTNFPTTSASFGMSEIASDSFDPGVDLPSVPSFGGMDLYFVNIDKTDPFLTRLNRDMRNVEDSMATWKMFISIPLGDSLTISWRTWGLPEGILILSYETSTGKFNIDMKSDTVFIVKNTVDIEIRYFRGNFHIDSMSLCPGWNLVSFPILPKTSTPILDLVPRALSYGYHYNSDLRSYEIVYDANPFEGYWIYVGEITNAFLIGMKYTDMFVDLERGWNLIGVPYSSSGSFPLSDISSSPSGSIVGSIYYFDACGDYEYKAVSTDIYTGLGYWILVLDDCELFLHGRPKRSFQYYDPEFSFEIMTGEQRFILAKQANSKRGLDHYDIVLPPPPPDANSGISGFKCDEFLLSRDVKPDGKYLLKVPIGAQLTWDKYSIPEGVIITLIDGKQEIDVSSTDTWLSKNATIEIEAFKIPSKVAVLECRPNPFNNAVEIYFEIPELDYLEISIYDISGHKVRLLHSKDTKDLTGLYIWNGTDDVGSQMPSGIYFVKLTTSNSTISKKVYLLR